MGRIKPLNSMPYGRLTKRCAWRREFELLSRLMKPSDIKVNVVGWAERHCSLLKELGLDAQLQEVVSTAYPFKHAARDLDITRRPL